MQNSLVRVHHALGEAPLKFEAVAGISITDLITKAEVPFELRPYVTVLNHGTEIQNWDYITHPGDQIAIAVIPQGGGGGGGKNILASIAMIGLAFAAPMAAGALGFTAGTASFAAVTAGITMVGALVISALIPPPSVANFSGGSSYGGGLQESATYSIGGQSNQTRKGGTIARVYGTHKVFPSLATTPNVDNVGKKSVITALYDFGLGEVTPGNLYIGNNLADSFSPNYVWHIDTMKPDLQFVRGSVSYDQLSYNLLKDQSLIVRTKDNSTAATVDITFPRGLVRFDGSGNPENHSVAFVFEYRKIGDPTWSRLAASQILGVDVNKESTIANVLWDDSTIGGDYKTGGTQWWEQYWRGGSSQYDTLRLYQDGRQLYSLQRGVGQLPKSVTVNGIQYDRGQPKGNYAHGTKVTGANFELVEQMPLSNSYTVLSAATGQLVVASLQFKFVTPAVYEVRLTRKTDDSVNNTIVDDATVTLVRSYTTGKIINLQYKHSMLEMQIEANDKISGVVQNLSCVVSSVLRTCTDTGWGPKEPTGNPAYVALDILTAEYNSLPLKDEQIDFASFKYLADKCDELFTTTVNGITRTYPRYTFNGVFDFNATVQEAVNMVLSNARAQLVIRQNGKFGVLIDEERNTPRQLITPSNSWGFSGMRTFTTRPDALRVSFISPEANYEPAQFLVFDDGKDLTNSDTSTFEDISTFGITSYQEAYRWGRFQLAQGIHRSEQFKVNMDIEHLACIRGDIVAVQHDVPMIGGMSFRVVEKYINSSSIEVIKLDKPIPDGLEITAYTYRDINGDIHSGGLGSVQPSPVIATWTPISSADPIGDQPIDPISGPTSGTANGNEIYLRLPDAGIFEGDLIVIGKQNQTVRNYIVLEITPSSDLSAELTLIPYVDIYKDGGIPDWDGGIPDGEGPNAGPPPVGLPEPEVEVGDFPGGEEALIIYTDELGWDSIYNNTRIPNASTEPLALTHQKVLSHRSFKHPDFTGSGPTYSGYSVVPGPEYETEGHKQSVNHGNVTNAPMTKWWIPVYGDRNPFSGSDINKEYGRSTYLDRMWVQRVPQPEYGYGEFDDVGYITPVSIGCSDIRWGKTVASTLGGRLARPSKFNKKPPYPNSGLLKHNAAVFEGFEDTNVKPCEFDPANFQTEMPNIPSYALSDPARFSREAGSAHRMQMLMEGYNNTKKRFVYDSSRQVITISYGDLWADPNRYNFNGSLRTFSESGQPIEAESMTQIEPQNVFVVHESNFITDYDHARTFKVPDARFANSAFNIHPIGSHNWWLFEISFVATTTGRTVTKEDFYSSVDTNGKVIYSTDSFVGLVSQSGWSFVTHFSDADPEDGPGDIQCAWNEKWSTAKNKRSVELAAIPGCYKFGYSSRTTNLSWICDAFTFGVDMYPNWRTVVHTWTHQHGNYQDGTKYPQGWSGYTFDNVRIMDTRNEFAIFKGTGWTPYTEVNPPVCVIDENKRCSYTTIEFDYDTAHSLVWLTLTTITGGDYHYLATYRLEYRYTKKDGSDSGWIIYNKPVQIDDMLEFKQVRVSGMPSKVPYPHRANWMWISQGVDISIAEKTEKVSFDRIEILVPDSNGIKVTFPKPFAHVGYTVKLDTSTLPAGVSATVSDMTEGSLVVKLTRDSDGLPVAGVFGMTLEGAVRAY